MLYKKDYHSIFHPSVQRVVFYSIWKLCSKPPVGYNVRFSILSVFVLNLREGSITIRKVKTNAGNILR